MNIADSALENLSGIVTRIRELAEQAANGSYSNTQRAALDAEAQELSKEYARIKTTTSFNGLKIFDGTLGSGLYLQLGIGTESSIKASVGGAIGDGTYGSASTYTQSSPISRGVTLGDLNGDGILDLVTSGYSTAGNSITRLGLGDGTFGSANSLSAEASASDVTLGDINNDGILDLAVAGSFSGGAGAVIIRIGRGDGTFSAASTYSSESLFSWAVSLNDLNNDGNLDLVSTGDSGDVTIRLGNGNGSFGASTSFDNGLNQFDLAIKDLNSDGNLDLITVGDFAVVRLGRGDGTFGTSVTYTNENSMRAVSIGDLNGDGILDLVTAGLMGGYDGRATVRIGTGNGSFGAAQTYATEGNRTEDLALADLNGDGFLDMISGGSSDTPDGYATIRLGNGNGTFSAALSYNTEGSITHALAVGDLNGDGVVDLITVGISDSSSGHATVRFGNSREGLSPLLTFSLKSKADALQAMGALQRTQENLSKQRGTIGASQSRVGIAINNLISSKENFSAAESRIRDADIATDSANLLRMQILQQAATSILSQANQSPQLALTLLR